MADLIILNRELSLATNNKYYTIPYIIDLLVDTFNSIGAATLSAEELENMAKDDLDYHSTVNNITLNENGKCDFHLDEDTP